jgi:hypothetical protein
MKLWQEQDAFMLARGTGIAEVPFSFGPTQGGENNQQKLFWFMTYQQLSILY